MNTPLLALAILLLLLVLLKPTPSSSSNGSDEFLFSRFHPSTLLLNGSAATTPNGLLQLTNSIRQQRGYTFYPQPIQFRNTTTNQTSSFSTTFVFAIQSILEQLSGNGIAFVLSPFTDFSEATGSQYFGLVNKSNNGNPSAHLFFVEFDTIFNPEIKDINDNHVGIDLNSVISNSSFPAGYHHNGKFTNLSLITGDPVQAWIDYDGDNNHINVTIAPLNVSKPTTPLLSSAINLSEIVNERTFVGFASTTGSFPTSHYVMGWSFAVNGRAQPLDLKNLPKLPPKPTVKEQKPNTVAVWVSVGVTLFVLSLIGVVGLVVMRRIKFAEVFDDWEQEHLRNNRFSYTDLYKATKGFRKKELLGVGGFGRVYKGVLPGSEQEVAVKRIPHGPSKDMKDFITEIVEISQLRHRNLVQQLGYCRRKGELLLVYDYMPNGSLDKLLFFNPTTPPLSWSQRIHLIKGVAAALHYLHEEWEKVIIHRDIKASNVLLDANFNAKLGDFGLARLYDDHGDGPPATHVVGTMGYIAPELTRTGRATKASDVFAFGMFVLEVVCGRRPIEEEIVGEKRVMVDWVLECWRKGEVGMVVDERMVGAVLEEVEEIVKLGLLCCHPSEASRPNMKGVLDVLEGDGDLPDAEEVIKNAIALAAVHKESEVEDWMESGFSPFISGSSFGSGR